MKKWKKDEVELSFLSVSRSLYLSLNDDDEVDVIITTTTIIMVDDARSSNIHMI